MENKETELLILTELIPECSREALVFLAKVAEQADRYGEMCLFAKTYVQRHPVLTTEERNIFSVAFKNAVGSRRASWRTIQCIKQEEAQHYEGSTATSWGWKECALNIAASRIASGDFCVVPTDWIEYLEIYFTLSEILVTLRRNAGEDHEASVFFDKMTADYDRFVSSRPSPILILAQVHDRVFPQSVNTPPSTVLGDIQSFLAGLS